MLPRRALIAASEPTDRFYVIARAVCATREDEVQVPKELHPMADIVQLTSQTSLDPDPALAPDVKSS